MTKSTDSNNECALNFSEKLSLVIFLADMGEKEADRLWRRFSVMLGIQGGLLALLSYAIVDDENPIITKLDSPYVVTLAVVGFFCSIIWIRIMTLSQFYESRWRTDMQHLIQSDSTLSTYIKAKSVTNPRLKKPIRGNSTGHVKIVIRVVSLLWLLLIFSSIYSYFTT